jgi:hypothetical protein
VASRCLPGARNFYTEAGADAARFLDLAPAIIPAARASSTRQQHAPAAGASSRRQQHAPAHAQKPMRPCWSRRRNRRRLQIYLAVLQPLLPHGHGAGRRRGGQRDSGGRWNCRRVGRGFSCRRRFVDAAIGNFRRNIGVNRGAIIGRRRCGAVGGWRACGRGMLIRPGWAGTWYACARSAVVAGCAVDVVDAGSGGTFSARQRHVRQQDAPRQNAQRQPPEPPARRWCRRSPKRRRQFAAHTSTPVPPPARDSRLHW